MIYSSMLHTEKIDVGFSQGYAVDQISLSSAIAAAGGAK
jgi:hypothetical protein